MRLLSALARPIDDSNVSQSSKIDFETSNSLNQDPKRLSLTPLPNAKISLGQKSDTSSVNKAQFYGQGDKSTENDDYIQTDLSASLKRAGNSSDLELASIARNLRGDMSQQPHLYQRYNFAASLFMQSKIELQIVFALQI